MNNKILLVEDEAMIREAFTIVLELSGYKVTAANDGQAALDFCVKNTYDLILLDLMMPVLDGVGFLRQANLSKTAPKTRVVVLSNLSSGEMINDSSALGVHRQEVKANLSPKDLVALVKEELSERETAAA